MSTANDGVQVVLCRMYRIFLLVVKRLRWKLFREIRLKFSDGRLLIEDDFAFPASNNPTMSDTYDARFVTIIRYVVQ